jgi:DNA-binding GntR family transcriptional regulator
VRSTLVAQAYDELRTAIISGEIPPGAPLRLEELARSLDMSISPVREAVRLLEGQGLAQYAPYRGAQVTELSVKEMGEIYEARAALERVAIRRAASRFTTQHEGALDDALRQLDAGYAAGDTIAIVRANTLFHTRIAVASDSQWLERLLSPLLEMSERYTAAALNNGTPEGTRVIEQRGHVAIVNALRTQDPDAAEAALLEHFNAFSELLAGKLGD